ncbi:IS6 family transposase [Candidatus Bathyarchaeota archaeon]|nr:IS6 family transposase [Candidatus Bathyarchaeota archaeon]
MVTQPTTREQRGQHIAQIDGQIKRIDANTYEVLSQSGHGKYEVLNGSLGWMCQCPDHIYRGVTCKHIHAVLFSQAVRAEVAVRRIEPITSVTECIYCGSTNFMKKGIRKNKSGNLQKFYCRDCHKYFTFNIGFERMKHNPKAVTVAMQLYFSGESLRNTAKSLRLIGVEVSYRTVLNWIKKYTRLMENYVEKITPNVSDTWRADEVYVKIKGDMKYLFAMMDDETRYWIAQEVAETKQKHDARTLFMRAKRLMGKKPKMLITDGLPSYSKACEWAFDGTKHIRKITLKGTVHNNNKMERLNGEIRDREKTMRGLKKRRTTILRGMQIYHNYIRPHENLNGRTPAEACGIKVEGKNKWKTLIQHATKDARTTNFKATLFN